ncbi:NAD-dependent epimerase/dehydratase family protein [Nocardia yunnanensis]|uniref:NAD-dependent epimerase/dehydratase family protein n=1 Tax=Nocardia yunnanensis TaxID=2382165 RepID=UPI001FEBAD1F|nr:NAD-dependent epimerase/dehydratase family protein [Nocardia yunnanensis]
MVAGEADVAVGHADQELQRAGYRVRGTVRSASRASQIAETLPGVELVEAGLGSDTGWEAAVAGCRYVLHTASPFPAGTPKHEDELVRPAVDGTLRVLRAAAASGVERVVVTSSIAAVQVGNSGRLLTEADWSDVAVCDAYEKSKTLAERAAWDFAAEHPDIEVAVLNPGMIIGPLLRAEAGTSVGGIRTILAGDMPGVPRLNFATVDVRDLAVAHRLALETPEAAGNRYICAGDEISFPEMARILAGRYRVSTRALPDWLVRLSARFNTDARTAVRFLGREERLTAAKAERELGWHMRPVAESLLDTADSLIRLGLVDDPGAPRRAAA